jgi:hypothetical protein
MQKKKSIRLSKDVVPVHYTIKLCPDLEAHLFSGTETISIILKKDTAVKINPFALLADDKTEAQLGTKILSLHGLLKTMIGEVTPTQEAIMDRAIVLTYKQKGITPDPQTYKNEAPILEDLYKTLLNMEEPEAKEIAFRLEKYVKGGFAGLFNQQTNYDVKNQLTVFSLKQLEDVLRPIAMHTILDFIWHRVRTKLKKRILIVDEAWYLMKYPDSASFLQGIAKRARKYYLGVTTLTQDIEDFLASDYGKAILSNSSMQILLKQGSSEVETLAKTLNLSEGEKQYLLTAQVGEGLLFAGQNHVTSQFVASQFEYDLITSKPQDLIGQTEQQAAEPIPEAPPTPVQDLTPALDNISQTQINPIDPLNQQMPAGQTPLGTQQMQPPVQSVPQTQSGMPAAPAQPLGGASLPQTPMNPLNGSSSAAPVQQQSFQTPQPPTQSPTTIGMSPPPNQPQK